jgi:hypothetical protein
VPPDRVLVVSSSEMKELVVINPNLQPFSEREALGQYWLKDVDNGAYRQEFYVAHISTLCAFSSPSRVSAYDNK